MEKKKLDNKDSDYVVTLSVGQEEWLGKNHYFFRWNSHL